MAAAPIDVVAGVIRDERRRILLAQRAQGSHLAGLWEFPGGKREVGESRWQALVRELDEELGIVASSGRPLISVPFSYADKSIRLDVWTVDAYAGMPWSREGQPLKWVGDAALDAMPMPDADRPAIAALRLPHEYLITPDVPPLPHADLIEPVAQALRSGIRLIQLRLPQWSRNEIASIAVSLRALAHEHAARLLVSTDIELAINAGLDGVHLPARIAAVQKVRPLPDHMWLGVSCHDAAELAHAQRIGADFATLSPVNTTLSHPCGPGLGWQRFSELVANATMPVYALGGLSRIESALAIDAGAQGIAAIRSLWPEDQSESD